MSSFLLNVTDFSILKIRLTVSRLESEKFWWVGLGRVVGFGRVVSKHLTHVYLCRFRLKQSYFETEMLYTVSTKSYDINISQ